MNMVTKCYNCGLPSFHGAAGYAGPQCTCSFQYKPNYDHNALADLLKERDTLRKQLEEARRLLREMNASGYDWHIQINAWLERNKQ